MNRARVVAFVAATLTFGIVSAASTSVTIGPGPAVGTDRAGVTWFEDFQDWSVTDVRALDDVSVDDNVFTFADGLDDSRDLMAFYYREDGGNLYFRVDLYDLAIGAEVGGLDVYVAIDAASGGQVFHPDFLDVQTDQPWELCLCLYQSGTTYGSSYRIYDDSFTNVMTGYLGSYFNSQVDAIEFGITKQTLIDAGWDGSSPLSFQVFTARDASETTCSGGGLSSDIVDAFVDDDRGCDDGVLNGGISSNDSGGRVYYASIAHGNQSVNKASDIGEHIYDSEASTGISGGTGFQRTLDTHEIFNVPLNIHPSGTLTMACNWARRPTGAADPQDGPAFLARIADFVDADQSTTPGSLIGGVLAEHIMPYFEGPVNAASIAVTDALNQDVYGLSASAVRVMHTPERVIRSQTTGLSPLDGHTFEDIVASHYVATYLDEVTHLHDWFYSGESCSPDTGYRHKVHRINGVYCFIINDREDQAKFGNHDGGMVLDTRRSLVTKALHGNASEIVTVFDDWEALAGKSFNPGAGVSVPNNNPNQYHNTIRWAANHPWIVIANLDDILTLALGDPAAFVIDQGTRFDLPLHTYQWLAHATEDSYDNWYYNNSGGGPGNEQDFYNLVPVITGPQGDYHARGVTPASDGPPLPSGKPHGDMNTPGTLLYDTWTALDAAPAGRIKDLGILSFLTMIYETAWHEEDQSDYSDTNCYAPWLFPDTSWDGVNTWALRLQNHVRQAGLYEATARWVDEIRLGITTPTTLTVATDLDHDGESEYVICNNRAFAIFEKYGGRCVLAAAYDPVEQDAQIVIGAPVTNPSAPGEEEFDGAAANRCSGFKDMAGANYVDGVYSAVSTPGSWQFTSPDGRIVKTFSIADGSYELVAGYNETLAGPLFIRIGLSPNPGDLATNGHTNLTSEFRAGANEYLLMNSAGGGARLQLGSTTWNPTPVDAGYDRRNLALTEQVEISGDGSFGVTLTLIPGAFTVASVPEPPVGNALRLSGPFPSPSRGPARLAVTNPSAGEVRLEVVDAQGRRVAGRDLGRQPAGPFWLDLDPNDAGGKELPSGIYFLRVSAGDASAVTRWIIVR